MLFNLGDWENIIHFGNLFASIGKKTYFLSLGAIPVTGVGFIAIKITDVGPFEIIEQILESEIIFKFPVIIWPAG